MVKNVNLTIRGIQHVGIPVTDCRVSEDFYSKLGFSNIMKSDFESDGEKGVAIMMEREGVIIELYEMPQKSLAEIKNRKDGHIDHIAFDVPDIDAAFTSLKDAGFEIEDPEPVFLDFWEKGCRYFTITGPDKERLEFNQIL
jgi:catechol 2,3-dioxygenase-like lactoylglutathione lyase family enzyme